MDSKTRFRIRRFHRFLAVFVGLQFIFWTASGLFFAWSDMDEVHGDYEKAPVALFSSTQKIVFPAAAIDSLKTTAGLDSLLEIRLVAVLGRPVWQIHFFEKREKEQGRGAKKTALADGETGFVRPFLAEKEASEIARSAYAGSGKITKIERIETADGWHEYREQPLPAWAVAFDDPRRTTVFVAERLGTAQKFRNRPWRVFDFLWMLHTMDFRGRDDISNPVLRVFSILGLTVVLSGFGLFFASRRRRKQRKT